MLAVNNNNNKRAPRAEIKIAGVKAKMVVDSGASVNILDSKTYDLIKTAAPLKSTSMRVYPYGSGKPLTLRGEITAIAESETRMVTTKVYVAQEGRASLLSYETAEDLGLMKITIAAVSPESAIITTDQVLKEYPELFQGLGNLRGRQVKLHMHR